MSTGTKQRPLVRRGVGGGFMEGSFFSALCSAVCRHVVPGLPHLTGSFAPLTRAPWSGSVVITALMVAAKFFDDFYFNNAFYARVGGISTVEVELRDLPYLFQPAYLPTDLLYLACPAVHKPNAVAPPLQAPLQALQAPCASHFSSGARRN